MANELDAREGTEQNKRWPATTARKNKRSPADTHTHTRRNDGDLRVSRREKKFYAARLHAYGFYIEFVIDAFDEICRSRGPKMLESKRSGAGQPCVAHTHTRHVWAFRHIVPEGKQAGGDDGNGRCCACIVCRRCRTHQSLPSNRDTADQTKTILVKLCNFVESIVWHLFSG